MNQFNQLAFVRSHYVPGPVLTYLIPSNPIAALWPWYSQYHSCVINKGLREVIQLEIKKQGLILEFYVEEPMTVIITRYFTFLNLFSFIFLSYFASFIIPLILSHSFIWFLFNKGIESPLSTFLPWQVFLKLTNILVEFCVPW